MTKDVDREQLNQITRDPSKVSVVDSIEELISKEFVQQISKKLCEAPAKIPTGMVFKYTVMLYYSPSH